MQRRERRQREAQPKPSTWPFCSRPPVDDHSGRRGSFLIEALGDKKPWSVRAGERNNVKYGSWVLSIFCLLFNDFPACGSMIKRKGKRSGREHGHPHYMERLPSEEMDGSATPVLFGWFMAEPRREEMNVKRRSIVYLWNCEDDGLCQLSGDAFIVKLSTFRKAITLLTSFLNV